MGASQRQIAEVMGVSRGSIEKLLAAKDREAYIEKKFGGNPFMPKEGRELTPSEIKHKADAAPHPDIMGRHHGKLPDCVMILPDIQFPFAHPDIFPFLSMVAQRYKPDAIVGIGDEIDAYYLSAFEKDPNALNASHEYETALDQLDKLYKLFPKVLALHSNHGRGRLEKARVRGGLLRQMVVDYQTFINAPRGWGFYDEIILGDVVFMHGDGEAKLTRPYLERRVPAEFGRHLSVVHGHRHEDIGRQAQCVVGDKEYWAAYTGCLINPLAPAFGYTKARKAKLGCGIITHGEYKQIRLKLDDTRRWTNEL
jgi:hypothetical protein